MKMNHFQAPKKQTQSNPVLSAACPELAVALSVVEGVVEWVEWANSPPILKFLVLNLVKLHKILTTYEISI